MANRDEIIAKIRALRAKAEDAAATEAEAMAAAEFAARLLTKHDIKPDELAEVAKSDGVVSGFRQGKVLHPVADYTANAIAAFTETKAYNQNGEIRYIGLEEDVLMAVYLTEMLVGAAKRGWVAYADEHIERVLPFKQMTHLRLSYFMGFTRRVCTRLHELKKFRDDSRRMDQGSNNSNALVVVKSEIIKRKMEEMGLSIGKARNEKQHLDPNMVLAGYAHGDKVNLGRPFGDNQSMGELA